MALNQSSVSDINEFGEDAPLASPSANFHPPVWGDFFIAYEAMEPSPEEETLELVRLRVNIKKVLEKTPDGSSLKLDLIDNIQRLGVSYHFKEEIEATLSTIKNSYHDSLHEEPQDDLCTVALRFRLLRQQGYHVSCEALKKFEKQEGEFEASLVKDAEVLLSLYEASHYRVGGENILEEGFAFTTAILEGMSKNCSEFISNKIRHALNWPILKTMNRVTTRGYISLYQQDKSHDQVLLKFAKLDYNRVQRLHQKELCALTKWWKDIDCARNFPFVRDRLVENYFIMMAMYFEPEYSLGRKILTKVVNMITIIDDIFDTYGKIDELLRLRDAIERWNVDVDDQLPPYMKLCYQFLLDVYTEMEQDLAKHGRSERVQYSKQEMKNFVKSCYEEAYWSHNNYIPTLTEIKETGVYLTTCPVLATTSLLGMGDLETEHSTAVDSYMHEHGAASQEAVDELQNQISIAWKTLNKECLLPSEMPLPVMERVLNFARLMFVMFKYGYDGYTHSETDTKQLITSILVDPIAM